MKTTELIESGVREFTVKDGWSAQYEIDLLCAAMEGFLNDKSPD